MEENIEKIYIVDFYEYGYEKAFKDYEKAINYVFERYEKEFITNKCLFESFEKERAVDVVFYDLKNLLLSGYIEDYVNIITVDLE